MEGATQKSLDEEIKSTDNIQIESTSQKPKPVDEDLGQVKPDGQASNNATLMKKDSKLHIADEGKEKCSCSAGTSSSNVAQNGQTVTVQEKDAVDSADTVITPQSKESENVTPNDKINGTHTHIHTHT